MEFKTKKLLTIPVLKLVVGEPRYVKVTGPMFIGKEIKSRNAAVGEKKRDPATLIDAVNLEDGSECRVICSAVVKGVFEDNYPDNGYVGKCFSLLKLERAAGKDYNGFKVVEIEDPSESAKPASHKR